MDKYDTLEYSRVKAVTVFMRLQNFLCVLINTNNFFGAIAKKAIGVKILILILISANVVYH
jgi:predicted membrane protein